MTYRHKREKYAQETKEILDDVLKVKNEEYGCLDCADTVRVGNPIEKMIAEETPKNELKSPEEVIREEAQEGSATLDIKEIQPEDLETYKQSDALKIAEDNPLKKLQKKKKGAYVEFKKDYRG
ncbi:MAG: hypothetical protein P1Q69_12725 [Candidatus Thorarchaeota archaeon]|nr:hypothetical protein [Candidatus Thorarchaeota archaeon]